MGGRTPPEPRQQMQTRQQVTAAIQIVAAVAEAIRGLGSVPSGHLYAQLLGKVTLEQYRQIIATLKRAELVSESNHMLHWIGPSITV